MGSYVPPLRDVQFVMHGCSTNNITIACTYQVDVDTINAIVEEAGKFSSQSYFSR